MDLMGSWVKVVGQGRLRHTGQPPRRQDRGRGAMGHFSLSARGPETSPCQCKSSLVHHSPQSRWRGCIFLFPHQSHPFPPCLRNSSHCHGNSNTKCTWIPCKLVIPSRLILWNNKFSKISRKSILLNMIGAVSHPIIFSTMHFLLISEN